MILQKLPHIMKGEAVNISGNFSAVSQIRPYQQASTLP